MNRRLLRFAYQILAEMRVPTRAMEAETQGIVITRHGKPAGVLIGIESEDDWFDYHLESNMILTSLPASH